MMKYNIQKVPYFKNRDKKNANIFLNENKEVSTEKHGSGSI